MKILVINAGSSSVKYQLIDMSTETTMIKGVAERIGQVRSTLRHGKNPPLEYPMPTHAEAVQLILDSLVDPKVGVIKDMSEISAVGHRVLLSGEQYDSSVLIDRRVVDVIHSNIGLGPLHMPANLMGIKACHALMPNTPMVAVFDNTFHSTMPDYAYMYAIPYEDYQKYGIRKYGFHGTSHLFVAGEMQKLMGRKDFKLVICHLGNGASVSAVKNGKCIDTSMGLTPLEGLMMGTRSGNIDPAALEYIMTKTGMNIHETIEYLNKKSGLLGVSGLSSDLRDLLRAIEENNEHAARAKLAIKMFAYRVRKYIGAYAAAMNGLDAIAMTGGIGEYAHIVRDRILSNLEYIGVTFDSNANKTIPTGEASLISNGRVKVYIVPTNEELVIARETQRLAINYTPENDSLF
jgi:acetate kinase